MIAGFFVDDDTQRTATYVATLLGYALERVHAATADAAAAAAGESSRRACSALLLAQRAIQVGMWLSRAQQRTDEFTRYEPRHRAQQLIDYVEEFAELELRNVVLVLAAEVKS